MGLVNKVVPLPELERETVGLVSDIENSPMAIRCLKAAMNADCDGQAGLQELAGNMTMLFYMTDEGRGGRMRSWRSDHRILKSTLVTPKMTCRLEIWQYGWL